MNVYLTGRDEVEFLGWAEPPAGPAEECVVDIPVGSGEALRVIYEIRSVLSLTDDGRIGRDKVVLLAPGQTPDFLPGWTRAKPGDLI